MSFCPTCGRPRTAAGRFCADCGHEFRAPAPDDGTAPTAEAPADATRLDLPLDATRTDPRMDATRWDATHWDSPIDATRLESAAGGSGWAAPGTTGQPAEPGEPDPFAAWFAPEVPAPPPAGPADSWQAADTVYGWPPPGPGFPAPPPGPVDGGHGRRPARGARAALIIAVLLVVLGAGGAAYAFISRSSTRPAATATPSAGASASAATSPSASPPASATASTPPSSGLVSVASGVGSNPATPQVETVLSHFFQGINTRSYPEYASALDAQERAAQTQASFSRGYSTTTDSGMTLTSLTSTGSGGLAATVTFTSHQAASSSVDNSTCNHWTLTFYLVPNGTGYLDGSAPSGYQPKYSDC